MKIFKTSEEKAAAKREKQAAAADKFLTQIFNDLAATLEMTSDADLASLGAINRSVGGSNSTKGFLKNGFGLLASDVGNVSIEQIKSNESFQNYHQMLGDRGYDVAITADGANSRKMSVGKVCSASEYGVGVGGAVFVMAAFPPATLTVLAAYSVGAMGAALGLLLGRDVEKGAARIGLVPSIIDHNKIDIDSLEIQAYETLAEINASTLVSAKTKQNLII